MVKFSKYSIGFDLQSVNLLFWVDLFGSFLAGTNFRHDFPTQKEDPRKFFLIKKFYLGVANLMIHNQMSHNQAKKWVLSLIYRAAIDFKKSKKKMKAPGPFP